MATNNGTPAVQTDAYTHSSSDSETNASNTTSGGGVVVENEVIDGQAAHSNKNIINPLLKLRGVSCLIISMYRSETMCSSDGAIPIGSSIPALSNQSRDPRYVIYLHLHFQYSPLNAYI